MLESSALYPRYLTVGVTCELNALLNRSHPRRDRGDLRNL